ncbi:hypothetical protein A2U01_0019532 [Trifolium medium]|uniref:Uncharacterized protein n=1 Tax=Trifolium medium TaxID=97028 RepID=A0A392NF99_9FABA|nr:hypothetical protein [Trifolium medium]
MSNERSTRTADVLQLDKETAYQKEIDVLKKKLVEKVSLDAKVKQVQEEAKYAGNYQKPNPYSNTYNPGWRNNPNLKWNQNSSQGNQHTQQPRKPSPLEESLNQFIKMS